jgi:biofilm PGA synthesis protein PgaD
MRDDTYIIAIKPLDRRHRARDTVLTLMMWGVYIYLWIPLITLGAWLAGFERFYEVMIIYGGFNVVMGLLKWYAMTIVVIAIFVIGWSAINYYRFHDKERRNAAPTASAREISEFFELSEAQVDRAASSRRLVIALDEHGRIAEIKHFAYTRDDEQPPFVEL